jgi:hypothetical protein
MKAFTINIPASNTGPSIQFSEGVLTIRGRSIPSDSSNLYDPVIESFYQYAQQSYQQTEIHIELEYVNSTSNRSLLNLLIIAEHLCSDQKHVKICWYYHPDDEIMYEQGKVFQELINIPIALIPL